MLLLRLLLPLPVAVCFAFVCAVDVVFAVDVTFACALAFAVVQFAVCTLLFAICLLHFMGQVRLPWLLRLHVALL